MSMPADAEAAPVNLRALRLKPGMFLQTQPMSAANSVRHEAQFCAAIEGKGIMVVPIGGDAIKAELKAGEGQIVRGFTGIYDFTFHSHVISHFTHPFAYTLLAYPEQVQARRVRSALRIKTSLEGTLQRTASSDRLEITVIDLSVAGAMVLSRVSPGAIGDGAKLSFKLSVDQTVYDMRLDASICHTGKAEGEDGYRTGFAFRNLGKQERLALQCFALAGADDGGYL